MSLHEYHLNNMSSNRKLGTAKKKKPKKIILAQSKIIIGKPAENPPSQIGPKEQTIKLKSPASRGGKMGVTIGARPYKYRKMGVGVTQGMGQKSRQRY